jgi:hypothetical protein
VEFEDLLDALLVLQNMLHTYLVHRLVTGREEGDSSLFLLVRAIRVQVQDVHDVVPVIADELVKLEYRPILLLLREEKKISVD